MKKRGEFTTRDLLRKSSSDDEITDIHTIIRMILIVMTILMDSFNFPILYLGKVYVKDARIGQVISYIIEFVPRPTGETFWGV